MKKRLLASLMCVCMLIGLLPAMALAAEEPVDVDSSTAAESVAGESATDESGFGVRDNKAFNSLTKELTIESFTTGQLGNAIDAALGGSAQRNEITSLTVLGGVLGVDDWATMKAMSGLVSVDLSGTTCENNEIPQNAFNNFNEGNSAEGPKYALTSFVFPEGITTIQNGAFAYCSNLEFSSADWLPDTVTTINPLAFQDCKSITSVDLRNVKVLGRQSFQRSGLSGHLALPDGLLLESNKTIDNFYIFDGCTGLTEITIGENITSKGKDCETPIPYLGGALFSNTSVEKLTIPGSIKYLGNLGAMGGPGCTLEIEEGVTHFGVYYIGNERKETTVVSGNVVGTLKIPDSVNDIYANALPETLKISKLEYHGPASGAEHMRILQYGEGNLVAVDFSGSGTTAFTANFNGTEKVKRIDLSNCEKLTAVSVSRWTCGGILDLTGCNALTSVTFGNNNDGSASSDYIVAVSNSSNSLSINVEHGCALITNGGTFAADTQFETGKLAEPTKEGYTFGGWYEDEDCTGTAFEGTPQNGQTYYAKWVTAITFDANGGEGTMDDQQLPVDGTTTPLNENTFTRVGYTFTGWNTKADGTGAAYADKATAPNTSTTLYAQWTPYTYTIKFNANGGAGNMDNVSAKYDQSITLPNNAFTMAGKKFRGWAVESDKTAVKYTNGAKVQNLTDVNGGEVTLYAVWGDKDAWNPTWTQQTKTYNGQVQGFDLAADFTATYQQNGQTVEPKNAGSYDVVISAAETADTLAYKYTFKDGLVIAPAPLTIQAEDKTIRAGKDLPEFTYTTTGLVEGERLTEEPTLTCDTDGKTPGEYPIVPSHADAGNNYEISYVEGTLTVTKRSSSGGSSTDKDYAVSVDKDMENGTVTVSPKRAEKGDTVTITVKPDKGYELDELVVTDSKGNELDLREKGDNKFTFKMPGSKVTVEATFRAVEEIPEVPQLVNPFVDVNENAYYCDAVLWAVEKGITGGTSAATFSPDDACTRAQLVTFLWRANGSPVVNYAMSFTDVPADAYYAEAVRWAVSQGITTGTSATTFDPSATVTRGQTVTFLWRAAGSPVAAGDSFGDVAADAYYAPAVAWAVREGITTGVGAETFAPGAACTRGQIVTFLYRDMVK